MIKLVGRVRLGIFLGILAGGAAQAEPQWTKLDTAPYTLNNKQDAIVFANSQRGWYGNGTGRVYRTDDAGTHWTQIWQKVGTYVRSLDFVDANFGFLGNIGADYYPDVTDTQPFYVTRDGGETWSPVTPVTGKQIKGVCAIDILKRDGKVVAIRAGGRVGGPAGMLQSFDQGKTWQARDMSGFTGMILDIKFVDDQIGFIAGSTDPDESKARARILKTSDGGKTWRAVFESPRVNDNNWKLAFPSKQIGYATIMSYRAPDDEARGYVVKTTDGGEHWQKSIVTHDRDWVPYGIAFLDEQHGFVGGSTGGYETRDGGRSWTAVAMGLSVNKIRFVDQPDGSKTAYAIGQDVYKLEMPAKP